MDLRTGIERLVVKIKRFPKPSLSPQQADGVLRSASRRKSLIFHLERSKLRGIQPKWKIKKPWVIKHFLIYTEKTDNCSTVFSVFSNRSTLLPCRIINGLIYNTSFSDGFKLYNQQEFQDANRLDNLFFLYASRNVMKYDNIKGPRIIPRKPNTKSPPTIPINTTTCDVRVFLDTMYDLINSSDKETMKILKRR